MMKAPLNWIAIGFWFLVIAWLGYCEIRRANEEWDDFATRFPAPRKPAGPSFLVQRLWLDNVYVDHSVRVTPMPSGLYLELRGFLGLQTARTPVLVPWSAVREIRPGLWIGPFNPAMTLLLAGTPYQAILLGPRGARAVRALRPSASSS